MSTLSDWPVLNGLWRGWILKCFHSLHSYLCTQRLCPLRHDKWLNSAPRSTWFSLARQKTKQNWCNRVFLELNVYTESWIDSVFLRAKKESTISLSSWIYILRFGPLATNPYCGWGGNETLCALTCNVQRDMSVFNICRQCSHKPATATP